MASTLTSNCRKKPTSLEIFWNRYSQASKTVREEIDPILKIEFDEARTGDAEHTHANISKANELLGYQPTVDIREGTRKVIEWYRENEEWYDPLVRNS